MTTVEFILSKVIEECAEIQKEACKALQFGLDSDFNGYNRQTNAQRIESEVNDLEGCLEMLRQRGEISQTDPKAINEKIGKVNFWLDRARAIGKVID